MTIRTSQKQKLESCYRTGRTLQQSTEAADVSMGTVVRYFGLFKSAGIRRGKRGQHRRKHPRGWYDMPVYDGPDWIGNAA